MPEEVGAVMLTVARWAEGCDVKAGVGKRRRDGGRAA